MEQIKENTKYNSFIKCSHSSFTVTGKKVSTDEYSNFDNEEIINIIKYCIKFQETSEKYIDQYEIKLMKGVGSSNVRVVEFRNIKNKELKKLRIHLDVCLKDGCETNTIINRVIFYSKKDQEKVKKSFYN